MKRKWFILVILSALMIFSACTPAAPVAESEAEPVQTEAVAVEEGQSTETTTTEVEVAESETKVGGTLVISISEEPDTLDMHHSSLGTTSIIGSYLGATLITRDPITDEFVPWLAESWSASEDGLQWEFKLRQNVKFHNGDPFTAEDYAFTINRALAPETMSPTTGTLLMGVASATALDEYTLQVQMDYPNYSFLTGMATSWLQPMPKAVIEEDADYYATHPIGVGPFKFVEWVRGDHITLVRNEEYDWAPEWAENIPPYIEKIEFRYIAEYATSLAGLEAGELDVADVMVKDLELINSIGNFQIIEAISQGSYNVIYMNHTREPFNDLKVRQALSMSIDPYIFINIIANGYGEPQYGPLAPSVQGYWDGVKDIGYSYNPERAKELLEEAGWVDTNGNGILDKDGQEMDFEFVMGNSTDIRMAELLQGQLKEIGVNINITVLEVGLLMETLAMGEYDLARLGIGWSNAQLLWAMFHTNLIGIYNMGQYSNPELDAILDRILLATNQEEYLTAAQEAQKFIVENALIIPTHTSVYFTAVSNRVKDYVVSPIDSRIYYDNAYLEE